MTNLPDFGPRPEYRVSPSRPGETSYARQRRWRQDESRMKNLLRPLRNYVNKTLSATGVEHAHSYASGRISGITHTSAGFETESRIEGDPPYVFVRVYETRSSRWDGVRPGEVLKTPAIQGALEQSGLVVEQMPTGWKVYPKEWVNPPAETPDLRRE